MGSQEWTDKVKSAWQSMAGEDGKRWARPEEPILHTLADEKAEPYVFMHNTNYRTSRKYINVEKVQILRQQVLECARAAGHARFHKCTEVASNVDRGPLARKRDVGFIYHTHRMRELQQQAAELEVEFPFSVPPKRS